MKIADIPGDGMELVIKWIERVLVLTDKSMSVPAGSVTSRRDLPGETISPCLVGFQLTPVRVGFESRAKLEYCE